MASAACPSYYCGSEWENLETALCPDRKNGGINLMIILRCGVQTSELVSNSDPTALDEAKVQALITGNDARVVPFIQITMDAPSAVTTNVYDPLNPEQTVTYDRTLTIVDPNVNETRRKFWDSINSASGFSNGGCLLWEADAERWSWVDAQLSLSGGRTSPENNSELQRFEYSATYRSKSDASIMEGTTFTPVDLVY